MPRGGIPQASKNNNLEFSGTLKSSTGSFSFLPKVSHQTTTSESKSHCPTLKIIITPASSGGDRFEARLYGDDRVVLCISRTPFLDAARQLIADGYDPNLTLILRRATSDTDDLWANLGTAASLTVEETAYGPKLRRWKPFSTLAVKPRIAFDDLPAITPAPRPDEHNRVKSPGVERNFETTP